MPGGRRASRGIRRWQSRCPPDPSPIRSAAISRGRSVTLNRPTSRRAGAEDARRAAEATVGSRDVLGRTAADDGQQHAAGRHETIQYAVQMMSAQSSWWRRRRVESKSLMTLDRSCSASGSSRHLPNQPAGSIMDGTAIVLLLELVCLGTCELEVDAMAVLVGGPSRPLVHHPPGTQLWRWAGGGLGRGRYTHCCS